MKKYKYKPKKSNVFKSGWTAQRRSRLLDYKAPVSSGERRFGLFSTLNTRFNEEDDTFSEIN